MGSLESEAWKACAFPWKPVWIDGGRCRSAIVLLTAASAGPSGAFPFRLKLMVADGNSPWWLTPSGAVVLCQRDHFAQRHHAGGLRGDVDALQRVGAELEMGIHLLDDIVLAEGREELRDRPLAEGVVERVVDSGRRDAETGGRVPVDRQRKLHRRGLLIAGHVGKLRQFRQCVHHDRPPLVQLAQTRVS